MCLARDDSFNAGLFGNGWCATWLFASLGSFTGGSAPARDDMKRGDKGPRVVSTAQEAFLNQQSVVARIGNVYLRAPG